MCRNAVQRVWRLDFTDSHSEKRGSCWVVRLARSRRGETFHALTGSNAFPSFFAAALLGLRRSKVDKRPKSISMAAKMSLSARLFAAAKAGDTTELRRLIADEGAREVLNLGNKERYGCKPLHYGSRRPALSTNIPFDDKQGSNPVQQAGHRVVYGTSAREAADHGCRRVHFRGAPTSIFLLRSDDGTCTLRIRGRGERVFAGACELLDAGQPRGRGELRFRFWGVWV